MNKENNKLIAYVVVTLVIGIFLGAFVSSATGFAFADIFSKQKATTKTSLASFEGKFEARPVDSNYYLSFQQQARPQSSTVDKVQNEMLVQLALNTKVLLSLVGEEEIQYDAETSVCCLCVAGYSCPDPSGCVVVDCGNTPTGPAPDDDAGMQSE